MICLGDSMEIIKYTKEYEEHVKELLVELQEYIAGLDKEGYNIITPEFKEQNFNKVMQEVSAYEGCIFLAQEQENIVGLVVGIINNEAEDNYDFKAPKRGRVTELVVSKKFRGQGVGIRLLEAMENYFVQEGCSGSMIGVFAYNEEALHFYKQHGYFIRTMDIMKKLD